MAIKVTKSQEDKRIDALQGKGSGAGGVGENVGQHNERFNGYVNGTDGHIISNGDYNHAENYKNTIQGESYSHAEGYINTSQGGNYNHIEGSNNTLSNGYNTHVGGTQNNITNATCSIVQGNYNRAQSSLSYSAIIGNNNTVSSVHASCIIGDSHYIVGSSGGINAFVCGQYADTRTLNIPSGAGDLRFLIGGSPALGNVFYITHLGEVYAKGSYNTMSADYADLFEWVDGNPENEDRRGYLVSLDGDKIIPAHGDEIYGIISANPSVIGNNPLEWHGKYKKDVFGCMILDDNGEPIISDDYDPEKVYVPRSQRPEWSPLGLVGRLIIVDNGTCKPNGYVSARNGIGTASLSPTNIRVLKRIDDNHVEVLLSRG